MLSIIIPAKNEEQHISRLLQSINNQDFKNVEVIVADGGSTDNTVKIAKKHGVRVVRGGIPAVGRNEGAAHARYDILLFLDADVTLPKKFLSKHIKRFIRGYDAATVHIKPASDRIIDKILFGRGWNIFFSFIKYFSPHACGFCIFATKDYFNRIGGFDTSIVLAEDMAFVKKAKKFGVFKSPKIDVSVRRLDTEGRVVFLSKMIIGFLHRAFLGEIRKPIFSYTFNHRKVRH